MLWNTINGDFMYTPVCDCNHFSIHFTPIMFGLLPLYVFMPGKIVLLIAHATAVWSAQFPLKRLGLLITGNPRITFFLVLINFLLGMAVKEDAGLYFAAISAIFWLFPREGQRSLSTALFTAAGVAGFFVIVFAIHPLFKSVGSPSFSKLWSDYGSDFGEIVSSFISSPHLVIADLATSGWVKMLFYSLFIPFLDWRAVLVMAPTAIILATANRDVMHDFSVYYAAPLLAPLFWGWCYSAKKFARTRGQIFLLLGLVISPLIGSSSLNFDQPKIGIKEDVAELSKRLTGARKVCIQSALMPHVSYDVRPSLLDSSCLKSPGAIAFIHPDLVSFPLSREELKTLKEEFGRYQYESRNGVILFSNEPL
jgi:uncharacterized membrane protein